MQVVWHGHACFSIRSEAGVHLVLDPFEGGCLGGRIALAAVRAKPNGVLISHDHVDHSAAQIFAGHPPVLRQGGVVAGIQVADAAVPHDLRQGAVMGANRAFRFEVDGISVCHLGDAGDWVDLPWSQADVLLVPVGGYYTVGPAEALEYCHRLSPKLIVPMHYRTAGISLPMNGRAWINEVWQGHYPMCSASMLHLAVESLPAAATVCFLDPQSECPEAKELSAF